MRLFLKLFTLPKEAQQVDRIIQKFGHKYQKDNNNLFNSPDAVYMLSFLMMMLQTDIYNHEVTQKMTLDQFIKLAQQIEGENLKHDYLSQIYYSIQKVPLGIHPK